VKANDYYMTFSAFGVSNEKSLNSLFTDQVTFNANLTQSDAILSSL
jgi:hypothetical protein